MQVPCVALQIDSYLRTCLLPGPYPTGRSHSPSLTCRSHTLIRCPSRVLCFQHAGPMAHT